MSNLVKLLNNESLQNKNLIDLDPDDYTGIQSLTEEESIKLTRKFRNITTGSTAAIPIVCGGASKCPWVNKCPIIKVDRDRKILNPNSPTIVPLGKDCVVEINLINQWTHRYIEEYNVNPSERPTEFLMVVELAEIELLLWRVNNGLSKVENAELIQETVIGVDRNGDPLIRKEVNAHFEAKERLTRRKSQLVKLMVGDRQERYKAEAALKKNFDKDASTNSVQLRNQINKLMQQTKDLDLTLKEKEGNLIDVAVL